MSKRLLLSIDGGGIRGIIPLCALVELEKQTGRAARDAFSFMAGTSTGAIIAAGLATGLPAARILELYQELGPKVFQRDWIGSLLSLGAFRYRTRPLAEAIRQFTDDVALNDLPIDILLSAMRVSDGHAWYFVRDNPSNARTTGQLTLVDCVTASAAAPTYFEPWEVPGIGACVDGGVGIAGNPIYQACVEAFNYTPPGSYIPAETIVVSLGTGYYNANASPDHLLDWVGWVIGTLLREPAEQQTELVRRHFATAATYRIDQALPRDIGMDDVGAIAELIAVGRECAEGIDWAEILAARHNRWRVAPLDGSALSTLSPMQQLTLQVQGAHPVLRFSLGAFPRSNDRS